MRLQRLSLPSAMQGLRRNVPLGPDVGVFIASGIGGFSTIEREHRALLEGGPRKISPFFIPSAIINLAAGQVSIPVWRQRSQFGNVHGLLSFGARDRRCF